MPYTTSSDVIALLTPGKAYDGSSDLTLFISTADTWIRRMIACAATKGITIADEDIAIIAAWLAAHAYVMSDETYTEKNTDRSGGKFKGRTAMRLEASLYGQTAMSLDPSNCLETINNPSKVVGAFWGGKYPTDQIDYEDKR